VCGSGGYQGGGNSAENRNVGSKEECQALCITNLGAECRSVDFENGVCYQSRTCKDNNQHGGKIEDNEGCPIPPAGQGQENNANGNYCERAAPMSACPHPTNMPLDNTLVYTNSAGDTFLYATMDFVDPEENTAACQTGFQQLPLGWHLAPTSVDSSAVAAMRPWGADAVSTGGAYADG
jgi:hypothetical protein